MTAKQATDTEVEEQDQQEDQQDRAADDADDVDGERLGEQIDAEERWGDDETVSDQATCPECGEPVHNLRMTCPMCGHEYKDKEYDDDEAGTEFRAGSEIDDDEVGEKVKEKSEAETGEGSSREDDSEKDDSG